MFGKEEYTSYCKNCGKAYTVYTPPEDNGDYYCDECNDNDDDRPTYYAEDVKKMLKDGVITAKELEEMKPIIIWE